MSEPTREVWMRVPEGLSKAAGYAVLLYVWGFFVVRARLHALGVPAGPVPVVDQSYLIQGGGFVVVSLELLARNLPILVTFVAIVAAGAYCIHRVRRRLTSLPAAYRTWKRELGPLVLTIALLAALGTAVAVSNAIVSSGSLLLPFQPAAFSDSPPRATSYAGALVLAVAGVLLLAEGFRTPALVVWPRLTLAVATCLAVLATCVVPMAFGAAIQPASYPVVRVDAPEQDVSGKSVFLVFATEREVVVYTGSVLRLISAEKAKAIDVLCEARLATEPGCPGAGGGGSAGAAVAR